MGDDRLVDLYEEVGRVVVPAAQLEQAITTLAYAVLGGDETSFRKTHGQPVGTLRKLIEPEAATRADEWWSAASLELLERAAELLDARHRVVHGYWTDIRGIVDGRSFVTFKPDLKSKTWQAQYFDLSQLRALAQQLESLSKKARLLADRLVHEVQRL
ncbi:MAG TPA: hypothetical protein VFK41_08940 [Nocardioidaceae bacterium]|nr:hypothetical protein [Nocardioidaceae bacterium]